MEKLNSSTNKNNEIKLRQLEEILIGERTLREVLNLNQVRLGGRANGARASLTHTNLERANLRDTNLQKANLEGVNLTNANLTNIK